jgi:type IV pilus assembly protein PilW
MMKPKKINKYYKYKYFKGFSLVELLVVMAITGVVMTAVYKMYISQQDSYVLQEQVAEMQQNARIAKYVMTREIRMAGYNPTRKLNVGNFVTSFVARLPDDNLGDGDPNRTSTGFDSIAFTFDEDGDGVLDANFDEQIAYRESGENLQRFDVDNDVWLTVVENIEAIGFAYAYANEDGDIEKDGGNIVWAIDSDPTDTNNQLNVKLDGNGDGFINVSDDTNDDLVIDENDAGTALASPVDLDRIRAVKIWLLVRTGNPDRNYTRANTYVVGNSIIQINDANRHHRGQLLVTTVRCRNMAL